MLARRESRAAFALGVSDALSPFSQEPTRLNTELTVMYVSSGHTPSMCLVFNVASASVLLFVIIYA